MSKQKYNTKGTTKQDLTAARAELKSFRQGVATLKKKGLLDKKYDARKVTPTRYLKSQLKQFENVLTGKAQVVKVAPDKAKYYAGKSYTTKNNRVVVPVAPNETVFGTHGDFRVRTAGKGGNIIRWDIGASYKTINEWEDAIQKKKIKLKDGEQISFQLFGNNAYRSFLNLKQMVEYLQYYSSYEKSKEDGDENDQAEYITNIVIFKIERDAILEPKPITPEALETRRAKNRLKISSRLDRKTDEEQRAFYAKRAKYAQEYRNRLKKDSDPTKLLEVKQKNLARAKKSYAKKKSK